MALLSKNIKKNLQNLIEDNSLNKYEEFLGNLKIYLFSNATVCCNQFPETWPAVPGLAGVVP